MPKDVRDQCAGFRARPRHNNGLGGAMTTSAYFSGDAKFWFGLYGKRSWLRAKGRSSRLIGQVIVFCVKVANGVRKRFSTLGALLRIGGATRGVSQSLIEQLQTFRRRPARGSPSLWISLMRPLLASLHRNLNWSRRLMHGSLDFPIVSVSPVGSPFSGGARRVVLPPSVKVSRCCIGRTRIWNRCRFLLIEWRAEFSSRRTRFSA
ncbi:hypothetical protein F2Q69_00029348 [Brassica cretica]|uniref:Uncharacterized protein n=1 Tax=Brassica cretica TaxID=69181 RepID=A0A8S9S891_BRACR|nr:hypothetical protein F2Q69_00029348 [Brassica cretica]